MKLLTSPTNDSKNGKEIVDLKSFSEKTLQISIRILVED